jgi:hypothetical protein
MTVPVSGTSVPGAASAPITPIIEPPEPEDIAPEEPEDGDDASTSDGDGGKGLGPKGQQALDRMKAKLREETKQRKAAEARLAEKDKPKPPEGEAPDPAAIREAALAEARAEVLTERALDKVEVLAAKTFANPALARKLLAGEAADFVDGGKVDTEAIAEALEALLKAEPYLAGGTGKRFGSSGDHGPRGSQPKDLAAQIADAQARGDVKAVIRLQNQKFANLETK